MIFSNPTPFDEALEGLRARGLLPTAMSSRELQRLDRTIREHALYSARTNSETLLQGYKDTIDSLLRPRLQAPGAPAVVDRAAARAAMKELLFSIGYNPSTDPNQPEPGSLRDLSSDPRIDLVISTNLDMAYSMAKHAVDQDPARLDAFPAQEMVRFEDRQERRPWEDRFMLAGSSSGSPFGDGWGIFSGRMVALKNHPIWHLLGSPRLFPDGLGNPYPPFAFNSGMGVLDILREEAEDMGLMFPGEPAPAPADTSIAEVP